MRRLTHPIPFRSISLVALGLAGGCGGGGADVAPNTAAAGTSSSAAGAGSSSVSGGSGNVSSGGSGSSGAPGAGSGAGGAATGGSSSVAGSAGAGGSAGGSMSAAGNSGSGSVGGAAGGNGVGGDAGGPALDPAALAKCTGTSPIICNFGGNPGHYDVTLLLGGAAAGSTLSLAESRRFMFPETATAAGASRRVTFTVNVRQPEGQPIEAGAPAGTPGLNLMLAGATPRLLGVGYSVATKPLVLWIAGDSTVCDQPPQLDLPSNERFTGWGQELPQYFKIGISVTNYADSGESSSSFLGSGNLFGKIKAGMKAGDYLFIQLGHNDKTTPPATYKANILSMITSAKNAGAFPVIVTPIARNDGSPLAQQHIDTNGTLNIRQVLLQLASEQNVPLIDLLQKTQAYIDANGRTAAQAGYVPGQTTHTNEAGALEYSSLLVQGIKELNLQPLVTYLR